MTAAVTRLPRKPVLIGLLVLFIAGNFLSAVADSYMAMMIGRIIAALCHGAFFGIDSVVAASLVPAHKKAGAIAIMFTGLTAANVLGVPFGTLLGQHFGWRSTFRAITAIGVVALLGIALMVPKAATEAAKGLRSELGAFTSGQVWLSIIVTILGFGGLFVGNFLGGKAADKALGKSLIVILAGLVAVLIFFALTASTSIATLVSLALMGGFGFATVPRLQLRVMHFASTAPTLASGGRSGQTWGSGGTCCNSRRRTRTARGDRRLTPYALGAVSCFAASALLAALTRWFSACLSTFICLPLRRHRAQRIVTAMKTTTAATAEIAVHVVKNPASTLKVRWPAWADSVLPKAIPAVSRLGTAMATATRTITIFQGQDTALRVACHATRSGTNVKTKP
ncbi:inner membrane transport protein YdhP [Arthrobacter sp. Rue61a]|nr:inner membrane transport protein YdhP [Arthrobacter sp. Rue61a]